MNQSSIIQTMEILDNDKNVMQINNQFHDQNKFTKFPSIATLINAYIFRPPKAKSMNSLNRQKKGDVEMIPKSVLHEKELELQARIETAGVCVPLS